MSNTKWNDKICIVQTLVKWYVGKCLPKSVWVKPTIGQNKLSNAFPCVIVPTKSRGTPIIDIASSLIIRFINMKWNSVLGAWNNSIEIIIFLTINIYFEQNSSEYCISDIQFFIIIYLTRKALLRAVIFKVIPAIPTTTR